MSPVDGVGINNPKLPVDRAVTEGRVPDRTPEQVPELHEVDCPAGCSGSTAGARRRESARPPR